MSAADEPAAPAPTTQASTPSRRRPVPAHPLDAMKQTGVERWLVSTVGLPCTRALCAALAALALGLLQRGHLGGGYVALQNAAALVLLALTPLLAFYAVPRSVPVYLPILACITCTAGPAYVRAIYFIVLGHAREGVEWYNAFWRIYAIMGLWLLIAVLIESKVKPFLRARAAILASRPPTPMSEGTSIVSRIHALKCKLRDKAIKETDAKLEKASRDRNTSQKAIESFDKTIERAHKTVAEAGKRVAKLEQKLASCPEEDVEEKKELREELDQARILHQGAMDHKGGLAIQVEAHKLILEQADEKIAKLEADRKTAMNLESHGFYR